MRIKSAANQLASVVAVEKMGQSYLRYMLTGEC